MTAIEFKELWKYFAARFTSVETWLLKNYPPIATNDRQVSQGEVLSAWRATVSDVTIEDAKSAVDALARGDEESPKGPDEYFRRIRLIARGERHRRATEAGGPKPKMIDGEWAYRCPICQDGGLVRVWHPATHEVARKNPTAFIDGSFTDYTCAVPCCCEVGARFSKMGPRLDVAKMVVYPWGVLGMKEAREQLVTILAERDALAPAGYDFS